jgi:hypothetical protein
VTRDLVTAAVRLSISAWLEPSALETWAGAALALAFAAVAARPGHDDPVEEAPRRRGDAPLA